MRGSSEQIMVLVNEYSTFQWSDAFKSRWLHVAAWRRKGGPVESGSLRLLLPRNPLRVLQRRKLIRPGALLAAKVSWPPEPARNDWEPDTVTAYALCAAPPDADILALQHALRNPQQRYDFPFGSFERDDRVNFLHGSADWLGRSVPLSILAEFGADVEAQAAWLGQILGDQVGWQAALERATVEHLYPLWADGWRDPDQPAMTEAEFVRKCALTSISVWSPDDAEFWLDDGGLFADHAIKLDATREGFIRGGLEG